MKLRKKSVLSLFLSIIIVFGMLPVNVVATENPDLPKVNDVDTNQESICGENEDPDIYFQKSSLLENESDVQQVKMEKASKKNITRDTVLVLDNSVSMEGEPLIYLKQSAIKFCESVLSANKKKQSGYCCI